jgi:hypothetical protein
MYFSGTYYACIYIQIWYSYVHFTILSEHVSSWIGCDGTMVLEYNTIEVQQHTTELYVYSANTFLMSNKP